MSTSVNDITLEVLSDLNDCVVVFDVETTGFSKYKDRIVEFGAIKLKDGKVIDTLSFLVNPNMRIPSKVIEVHGITNEMVQNEPNESFYAPKIVDFIKDACFLVGHNASFDVGFLEELLKRCGYGLDCEYIDTLKFSMKYFPNLGSYKLLSLANHLNIPVIKSHRALADVETTVMLLRHIAYKALNYK